MAVVSSEHPRDILNEIKWRDDLELSRCRIFYVHRGAPGDSMCVNGDDIIDIGRSFMVLANSHIPYHRIYRIVYAGEEIYSRMR